MGARSWCWGTFVAGVNAGLEILSNLAARFIFGEPAQSWPFGDWFDPNGTDPNTGVWNNQMGVQNGPFSFGVWVRGLPPAPVARSARNQANGGALSIATWTGGGTGQVTVAVGSAATWQRTDIVGGPTTDQLNPANSGVVTFTSQNNNERWFVPLMLTATEVRAPGDVLTSTATTNSFGQAKTHLYGGNW